MQIFSVISFFFLEWTHTCQMWIFFPPCCFFSKRTALVKVKGVVYQPQGANYTRGKRFVAFPTCAEFACLRPDFRHRLAGLSPRLIIQREELAACYVL